MRLCTIDMPGLEYAIETGNAVLLVELGALREIRNAIEILDLEKVRAPSVPPPTILDDTISVKCCDVRYSRKYLRTAA